MSKARPADVWVDLDHRDVRSSTRKSRDEAEDRAELAALYDGDWMTLSDALAVLLHRGSTREEAIGSLLMWLRTNDGQAPHLRARAEHARRHVHGGQPRNTKIMRDCIVHGWEWAEEVTFADWGSGTFTLMERDRPSDRSWYEVNLIGVTVSRDDLAKRLSPSALDAQLSPNDASAPAPPIARKPMYDERAFLTEAADALMEEGGFGPAYSKADLYAHLDRWCGERWPRTPSRSWMYDRFDEAHALFLSDLSKLDDVGLLGRSPTD